jgi:hypothetical protein
MRDVGTIHFLSGNSSRHSRQAAAEAADGSSRPRPRGRDGQKPLQTSFWNLH